MCLNCVNAIQMFKSKHFSTETADGRIRHLLIVCSILAFVENQAKFVLRRRWCPFNNTHYMAILNNLILLINKVSKTKDQSGPFVFMSLLAGCCDSVLLGSSHNLIIPLSTAFVRWNCRLSREVNVCFKDIEKMWAKYGVEHSSETSISAAFSRRV